MAVVAVGDFDAGPVEGLIKAALLGGSRSPPIRASARVPVPDSHARHPAVAIATDPEATGTTVERLLQAPGPRRRTASATTGSSIVEGLYAPMLNERLDEISQQPDPPFLGAGGGHAAASSARPRSFSLRRGGAEDRRHRRGLAALLTEVERVRPARLHRDRAGTAKTDLLRSYEQAYAERGQDRVGHATWPSTSATSSKREPLPGIAVRVRRWSSGFLPGIGARRR